MDRIDAYLLDLEHRGLRPATIRMATSLLRRFRAAGVPVERDAVLAWLAGLQLKPASDQKYRTLLNQGYPELKLPRRKVPERLLSPQDLVTPEDVRRMVAAANNPRDRALLMMLWETGGRAQEVLGIRVKDVQFDTHLARVRLDGKTGPRVVPVIESVPYLQAWLNFCGPLETEDRLWEGRWGPIRYHRLRDIVTKWSRHALGRRIPCHRFRHSRATYLAKQSQFNEALVCQFGGWKVGSRIVATYVHLAGRDLEPALLELAGIQSRAQATPDSPLKPITCARGHTNPGVAQFCSTCGLVLDAVTAQQQLADEAEVDAFLSWLATHPERVRQLKREMLQE